VPSRFTVGAPYFLLRYFDDALQFPEITSLVYLGKESDRWLFQDAASYVRQGPYPVGSASRTAGQGAPASGEVYELTAAQLDDVLTLAKLAESLSRR
jgi:hypothetical protein